LKNPRAALDRALRRLGRPGVAGVGVLLFCAMFWGSAVAPLNARLSAANGELRALQAKATSAEAGGAARGGLDAFYGFFVSGKSSADWLQKIFALAEDSGIALQRGSYRYNRVPGERIARYEITLPVTGSYVQIRRFLASVLNEIPVASLDGIAFEKKRIGDSDVEAQLRLTLYLDAAREASNGTGAE
jgi:hypothetical protein